MAMNMSEVVYRSLTQMIYQDGGLMAIGNGSVYVVFLSKVEISLCFWDSVQVVDCTEVAAVLQTF